MISKKINWLVFFLLVFVLMFFYGCKKNQKFVKIDSTDNETEQVTTKSKNINLLNDIDSSFLQNMLSNGVWLSSLNGRKKERNFSFGKTWLTPSSFLVFEFNSEKSFLYYGFSEGGPAFDHVVGAITRIAHSSKNLYELEYNPVSNLNNIIDQNGFLSQKENCIFSSETAKIIFLLENEKLILETDSEIGDSKLYMPLSFEKNTTKKEIEYESRINDNGVRIRSGPSLLESVISHATRNQKIHIISKSIRVENIENLSDYWFEVEFENGIQGWVYGAYIDNNNKEVIPVNTEAQMVSESER